MMQAMPGPILYIFSGLPGVGKTTLARKLATSKNAAYLRIDTVEQGLRDLCDADVEGEGYRLSYRIASDNLGIGVSVVADSCNPIELTRHEWHHVADQAGADFVDIEVVCSDRNMHRERIECRASDIDGLSLPGWQDVEERDYEPWTSDRILIDACRQSGDECFRNLMASLDSRASK